jgi:plasmid stabilization system protein ParE
MSYDVFFTPLADGDLQNAFDWYESQKSFLGWEFRENVSHCIDQIIDERVEYQLYSGNIRRIKLLRFPFNLYYIKNPEKKQITVLGVFHIKRNPEQIKTILR